MELVFVTKMEDASLSNSSPLGLLVGVLKFILEKLKRRRLSYGDSVDQGVTTDDSEGVEVPQVEGSGEGHAEDDRSGLGGEKC